MEKYCPKCFKKYPQEVERCPEDGSNLVSTTDRDLTGEILDERYTVLERIGRGGMGIVYKAEQQLIKRIVALKVLRREIVQDESAVKRFLNEARAISSLDSRHTVTLHDFGVTRDGLLYYTMELLKGRPLSRVIKDEAPLDPHRAVQLTVQVCRSLEEAHEHSILHRDIKPDNIFVITKRKKEQVKVLDFGIAKLVGDTSMDTVTRTGMIIGTPHYLSPEQALGNPVVAASDLYSVAIVLYEMLAGTTPFNADTPMKTMWAHIKDPVPSLQSKNPDVRVSAELELFLARALEKDSAKRFQSADAFADALEKALDEESATSETVALKPLMSTENGLREKDDTAQVESAGENMPAEEPHTALWRASKKPQDEMAAVAPSSFEPTVETPAEMAPASDVPVSDEPRPTTDISSQIAPPEPEQPTPLSLMDVDAARGNDEAVPSPTGDLDGSAADAGAAEEAETGALDKRPYGPETLSMLRQASSPRGYWIAGGAGTLLLVVVLLVWSPWAGSGTRPSGPADVSSTRESAAADASGTLDVGLSGTAVATNESERSAARHEGRQDDPLRGAGNSLSRGSDLTTEPAAPVTVSLEDVRSSAGEVVSQVALASDVQDSPSGDAVPNAALDVSAGSAASAIDERTGTESAAASKEEPVSAPSSNSGQSKPDGGRQSAPAERRPEQKEPVKVSEPRKTSEKKAESRQVRKSSGHEAERNRDMPRGDSDHESKATAKVDVESQTARLVKKAQGYIIAGSFEKALDALSEAKSLGGRRNQIRKMTKKCYEGIKTRQAKELVGQAVSAFRRRDFDSCISLAAKARKLDSSNGDAETLLNECKEKKDLEGMKF